MFDSSRGRGEPLMFEVGTGMVIKGFNNAVVGMTPGESKTVVIPVEEAYGPVNPEAVQAVSKNDFPEDFVAEIGASVTGQAGGQNFLASIVGSGFSWASTVPLCRARYTSEKAIWVGLSPQAFGIYM